MRLAIITPSYRNDWPLFKDLHESVLLHTQDCVQHYVIVPNADFRLFSQTAGPRCVVISEESLYPPHFRSVASTFNRAMNLIPPSWYSRPTAGIVPSHARIAAINLKRPFHPIRGWIMQQALKMEMCRRIDAEVLHVLDSDVVLIRQVTATTLCRQGRPRFYRLPRAVDANLPRHVQWHAVSRKLFGLPPPEFPAPDYVSSLCVWDPHVLRAMLTHIERVTGRYWMDAVTAESTFSEWTLYGVFADNFVKDVAEIATESSLCHSYWDHIPLTMERAAEFLANTGSDDVAILIQSKSGTPLDVRRAALRSFNAGR